MRFRFKMQQRLFSTRSLLALLVLISLFALLLIFYTLQILSSQSIGKVIVPNRRTIAFVDDYDFWTKYYNDDRFGRTWEFKISQKYDNSELHKYDPVVVIQKDAGLPGEMGN